MREALMIPYCHFWPCPVTLEAIRNHEALFHRLPLQTLVIKTHFRIHASVDTMASCSRLQGLRGGSCCMATR